MHIHGKNQIIHENGYCDNNIFKWRKYICDFLKQAQLVLIYLKRASEKMSIWTAR